jgi:ATP-binding cassette subfamily F protein 3
MPAPLNLLQLNNGAKAYSGHSLFEAATLAVNEGEHIGVIGPNGAGKTTLFKILIGQEELDGGTIVRSQSLSLGYLSQHDTWAEGETGNSFLERTSRLPLWQVKSAGRHLQISEEVYSKPISSLSGGYRMRIKLVGLLGQDPNLMLLDEPTNYLDLETTLLLERFLQNYEGAILLISHDREFLRRTTDHIVEVEAGEITKYNGNIDDYFEQKELLRTQLAAQAATQALKRKAILDFVNRFGAKATKAKQAQSKLKNLEKMETIEFKPIPVSAVIQIPNPTHVGKSVLRLEKADFAYGDKTIIKNVNVDIQRGDHFAVVGLNGTGKSTLLKGLAGALEPRVGSRILGYQAEIAIFNQHVIEVLNPAHTVFESLQDGASLSVTPQEIRNMAGSLLFSSDHINKKVKVLSGGEKSRVALGRILLKRVPCLLLDEPTNHLDFQTVEALTQSLQKFSGTLVVVSHDRGFIRRVATKILQVGSGEVHLYPGTYDEYVWSLQRALAEADEGGLVKAPSKSEVKATPEAPRGAIKKERDKQVRALDRKIAACEEEMGKLEKAVQLYNEKIAAGDASPDVIARMSFDSKRIQELETEWMILAGQREKLTAE